MKKTLLAIFILLSVGCHQQTVTKKEPVLVDLVRYTNLKAFNGTEFIQKDLCVANSFFVECSSNFKNETVVDLKGLHVTPPFGDSHTHHFDSPFTLAWHNAIGIQSGAFYAMTMTAPTAGVVQIREKLALPEYVDVASSMGGITGPNSHPAEVYEALALNIRSPEERSKRLDEIKASTRYANNAYYVVTDEDSVKEKLTLLLSNKPDHIKVFLRSSDRYKENWGKWGPGGGIDPKLLPLISKISREHGLRLAVANSNVADFRESLNAEANIVTHLPCYQDTESDTDSEYYKKQIPENCLLSDSDANKAAEINMASILITTEWEKDRPQKLVDWEVANVKKLKDAGARLSVATNNYGATLTGGLIAAVEKGFFSADELLRIATMDTPRIIFPKRSIGCLKIDCEASFIGFSENPLTNFDTIKDIQFRLKEGKMLTTEAKKDK